MVHYSKTVFGTLDWQIYSTMEASVPCKQNWEQLKRKDNTEVYSTAKVTTAHTAELLTMHHHMS